MGAAIEKDLLRRNEGELLAALSKCGADCSRPKAIRCPFHDDKNPSAGVYCDEQGVWRFKCHGCGINADVFDVQARWEGKKPGDVLRELKVVGGYEPPPKVYATLEALKQSCEGLEACFCYVNPDSKAAEMVVLRCRALDGRKDFVQAKPVGGGFVKKAPAKPWPIYNRTRLRSADKVIVVEGEKCVHALADVGVVATTSPGGAGKAAYADWSPLAGKEVFLWPDNDEPDPRTGKRKGFDHMHEVGRLLEQLRPAVRLRWIDPDRMDLPPKGDVVEYLDLRGGDTLDEKKVSVLAQMEIAEPMGAAQELGRLLDDTVSGKRRSIDWPWKMLSRLTNALLPGTVTCLCGDPGATKSFMILQACMHWYEQGISFSVFELEEDRAYHLNRALAQREDRADLTDPHWINENAAEALTAFRRQRDYLDGFGRHMRAAPDEAVELKDLLEWTEQQAAGGSRIICIDPVTAAQVGDKVWVEDQSFIMEAKGIARRNGCSVVLVTHPRKGSKTSTLHDLAGGAAYQRFAQTVLWVSVHDKKRGVLVRRREGKANATINRSVWIRKARNGRGAGLEVGFYFAPGKLTFAEQGVVEGPIDPKLGKADGDEDEEWSDDGNQSESN